MLFNCHVNLEAYCKMKYTNKDQKRLLNDELGSTGCPHSMGKHCTESAVHVKLFSNITDETFCVSFITYILKLLQLSVITKTYILFFNIPVILFAFFWQFIYYDIRILYKYYGIILV